MKKYKLDTVVCYPAEDRDLPEDEKTRCVINKEQYEQEKENWIRIEIPEEEKQTKTRRRSSRKEAKTQEKETQS